MRYDENIGKLMALVLLLSGMLFGVQALDRSDTLIKDVLVMNQGAVIQIGGFQAMAAETFSASELKGTIEKYLEALKLNLFNEEESNKKELLRSVITALEIFLTELQSSDGVSSEDLNKRSQLAQAGGWNDKLDKLQQEINKKLGIDTGGFEISHGGIAFKFSEKTTVFVTNKLPKGVPGSGIYIGVEIIF